MAKILHQTSFFYMKVNKFLSYDTIYTFYKLKIFSPKGNK